MSEQWLKNLKAGDKVFLGDYVHIVERTTKSQIMLEKKLKS